MGADRLFARQGRYRPWLQAATSPRFVLLLYVGTLWLWHAPPLHDAGLRSHGLHAVEHVSVVGAALLFWWLVTLAAPRIGRRSGYGWRIALILAAYVQNQILGVGLILAGEPLYEFYSGVPRLWGLSVLQDQTLGGGLMWVPGELTYAGTAIVLLMGLIGEEEPVRGVAEVYPDDGGQTPESQSFAASTAPPRATRD